MKRLSTSEAETINFGIKIGNSLKGKPLPVVVLIFGDIGVGKTTLIKGIGLSLGLKERDIASASFIIVSTYDTVPPLCHIDLYRLDEATDIDEIGFWDYLFAENISVIEWAEKLRGELPHDAIKIRINEIDETTREIVVEGLDEEDWDF